MFRQVGKRSQASSCAFFLTHSWTRTRVEKNEDRMGYFYKLSFRLCRKEIFMFKIEGSISNQITPPGQPLPSPTPEPIPLPHPQPVPGPDPQPVPIPNPQPIPMPEPQPTPVPPPQPIPEPQIVPTPQPQPIPLPTPQTPQS